MDKQSTLCHAANSLLLVVDIQPALTAAMPEEEAELMLNNTSSLLQAAGTLDIPVLLTEQYPKGLGTTEQSLLEHLPSAAHKLEKTSFSCCAADGFVNALADAGRDQIVMVGQEAHVCVLQSAFELLNKGLTIFVAEDGVCSRMKIIANCNNFSSSGLIRTCAALNLLAPPV